MTNNMELNTKIIIFKIDLLYYPKLEVRYTNSCTNGVPWPGLQDVGGWQLSFSLSFC